MRPFENQLREMKVNTFPETDLKLFRTFALFFWCVWSRAAATTFLRV